MIRHVAGIAEIVDDVDAAVHFYREVLGFAVQREPGAPYAEASVPGILHFGIWSRAHAAQVVFKDAAAADRVRLGFCVGFEVDALEADTNAITGRGWVFAQPPQDEPWGQRTSRFVSPSGALCELSETPSARRLAHNVVAER
jgi:catechol 2,3-dioxygenase-like lactoylglutathione lyase family enzyme